MKYRRMLAALIGAVTAVLSLTACAEDSSGGKKKKHDTEPLPDITTAELVKDMGIGINLGNTFESCGTWIDSSSVSNYETGWGSPVITQPMIAGYAKAGFGVLRIPAAWSNMMQDNYTIHPDYLARVHEVVRWALEAKLYVILNIHYDGGWWADFADAEKKDACMQKYIRIWEQLSAEFGDEGDHLVFESLNEEGCWDTLWNRYGSNTHGKAEAYALLNEINQTFVNTVRGSGGKNAQRHLLIAGYATDIALTCDDAFRMPEDPAGRCAVSVHYYTPATFCILEEDANWGKMKTNWGSPRDLEELNGNLDRVQKTFADRGIPVIIGEYGVTKKKRTDAVIRLYLSAVCEGAVRRGLCPVLWDTPGNFYDRANAKMYDEELRRQLLAAAGKPLPEETGQQTEAVA